VGLTRYVSLGSMIGAGALAVVLQVTAFNTPMAWVGTAVSLFVVFTHRDNIKRLRRGEERRIGSSSAKEASAS
jgi:glycerol-3-phosphate acyltransferase PlsY